MFKPINSLEDINNLTYQEALTWLEYSDKEGADYWRTVKDLKGLQEGITDICLDFGFDKDM